MYGTRVLAQDIRFEGWDADDWVRLLSLFEGGPVGEPGLLVLHDGRRVRKVLHGRAGRLDPGTQPWGRPLEELAREHGAGWVVALHEGALEEALDRLGARVQRGDDLLDQAGRLLDIVRELSAEGALSAWPRPLPGSLPSVGAVRRAMDLLCPPGRSVAVGLFDGGALWTALVLHRGRRGFEQILGPEFLRPGLGLLSGDVRRDYWHLLRVIERQVGPVHAGLFTEVTTLRRLLREGRAGSWARAVAVRDVVLAPLPAALALPLSVDAARGLTRSSARALARLDLDLRLASLIDVARAPATPGTLWHSLQSLLRKLGG